jgi:REP element-mobilizing transposase RayT
MAQPNKKTPIMPRKPRFFLPNVPVHMMIRGNNRQAVFADNEDYFAK